MSRSGGGPRRRAAYVAVASVLLSGVLASGAVAPATARSKSPPPLSSDPAPSVASSYGSGAFGTWTVDPFGLPVYRYEIDQARDPAARRVELSGSTDAWHQIGNDRIQADAHNDGRVQFWSEERLFQWLNLVRPDQRHYGGGYGYLAAGRHSYSTLYDDAPPGSRPQRWFGVDYLRRATDTPVAGIEEAVSAPFGDDPLLIHEVTIRNTTARRLRASWFEYWDVSPASVPLNLPRGMSAPSYDAATQTLSVQQLPDPNLLIYPNLNTLTAGLEAPQRVPVKDLHPLAIFASALGTPTTGFDTSTDSFFGNGTRAAPQAVVEDRTYDSIAAPAAPEAGGHTLFAFRSPVDLGPGQSVTLRYAYGTAASEAIARLVTRYRDAHHASLLRTLEAWRTWLPKVSFGSQYRWLARELQWDAVQVRQGSTYHAECGYHVLEQGDYYSHAIGVNAAFRDPLMFALPMIYAEPELAREVMRYSAAEQTADIGDVPWGVTSLCRRFNFVGPSGDMDVWFMLTASEYALATRDPGFFDEVVPFGDRGSGTLWDHLKLAFRHQETVMGPRAHGLYSTGTNGDWTDLAVPVLGLTESTLITAQVAYIYPRLAEVADMRGDRGFAAELRARAAAAKDAVQREWTGRWFSRGYAGANQLGRGAIYGEPQPWALLAGAASPAQARTVVAAVRRFLTGVGAPHGPSRIGSAQSPAADDPDVTEHSPDTALASYNGGGGNAVFPGGVSFAINGWLTWALGELDATVPGASRLAWDELVRNTLADHAAAFPKAWNGVISVSDSCSAYYDSDPSRCGIAIAAKLGYTGFNLNPPAWSLFDVIKLAGIDATASGYRITPHVPLRDFSVRFPLVGVDSRPGALRGYVQPQQGGLLRMQVAPPAGTNASQVLAFVDGHRVASAVRDGLVTFGVPTESGRRIDWALVDGRTAPARFCPAPRTLVGVRSRDGRIVVARVYENGRLVLTVHGRSLRSVAVPRPRGNRAVVVTVVAITASGGRLVSTRTYRGCTKTRRRNHTIPARKRRRGEDWASRPAGTSAQTSASRPARP